jgi:predicted dehydrogenase
VQADALTLYRDIEVEDTLAATLRFENGAMATIAATTTTAPGFPHRVEIYGSRGTIQVEGEIVGRWETADGSEAMGGLLTPENHVGAGSGGDPRDIAPTGHIAIVRNLIESVRAGRPAQIDGAEGRRSLATVLAIYGAAGLM